MGTSKHTDGDFFTVLLQDYIIGGLQVLHQKHWIDVRPIPGALIVNIRDLLQANFLSLFLLYICKNLFIGDVILGFSPI